MTNKNYFLTYDIETPFTGDDIKYFVKKQNN